MNISLKWGRVQFLVGAFWKSAWLLVTVVVRLDRNGLNTTKIRKALSGTVEGPDGVERVEQSGPEIIDAVQDWVLPKFLGNTSKFRDIQCFIFRVFSELHILIETKVYFRNRLMPGFLNRVQNLHFCRHQRV